MILWRLSIRRYARTFDGGYGLANSGRWNSIGHRITYMATSPSLCALEKLVHVEDPSLLPELDMIAYVVPDDISCTEISLSDLPPDWISGQHLTQARGDRWLTNKTEALMFVPSAVIPLVRSPDVNVLVNHAHPDAARIATAAITPFAFDARLLPQPILPPSLS